MPPLKLDGKNVMRSGGGRIKDAATLGSSTSIQVEYLIKRRKARVVQRFPRSLTYPRGEWSFVSLFYTTLFLRLVLEFHDYLFSTFRG